MNENCINSRIAEWLTSVSENATCFIIASISFLLILFYAYSLFRNSRNNSWRRPLIIGFFTVLVIGIVVHFLILIEVGGSGEHKSVFSIILMSIICSLELFFGSTKMFDNGIQEVLFGTEIIHAQPVLLILLTALYIAAMITTAYLIFMFFVRHYNSRRWLRKNRNVISDKTYVFFGINEYVRNLITDIRKKESDALILVVDYLKDSEKDIDISVLERARTFVLQKDETVDGATMVLKAKTSLANANHKELCESLGLKYLREYLDSCKNIYLLMDNQEENIAALNNLLEAGVTCDNIFCHARNNELNREIEEAYYKNNLDKQDGRVKIPGVIFVDSSMLSVRSLVRLTGDKLTMPVDYVKIAQDPETHQNLGYVETGFKAMILGFGETGQEALGFLYEYGAFVGKDKKKAPFECHVYDSRMDDVKGSYMALHPGMTPADAGVHYHSMEIGKLEFLDSFKKEIADTNYIVVSVGSDENNLNILQFIIQNLGSKDISSNDARFCIMVRMYNPNSIVNKTLESLDKKGKGCIHRFGDINEIWKDEVITDEIITEEAKKFHANYLKAKYGDSIPEEEEWDYMTRKIHDSTVSRRERMNAIRTRAQNYSNYLHVSTKKKLMDGPIIGNAKAIAECIPCNYEGSLFNGDSKTREIIEYMAIGEHIRWAASHTVLGYLRGTKTDPELKTHKYIKDYTKLAPQIQLYDWMVVRTTLEWEPSAPQETLTLESKEYLPHPSDLTDIELPEELLKLRESIAENVHEVWAEGRIREGWQYGPKRNDKKKTHPCLVPYSELSESEKQFDRETAMNTLKLIVKLGYKINE